MVIKLVSLEGNVLKLLRGAVPLSDIYPVRVRTNVPPGPRGTVRPLFDLESKTLFTSQDLWPIDENGDFTVPNVITYDSTGLNWDGIEWSLEVRYNDPVTRAERVIVLGPYQVLGADGATVNIAGLEDQQGALPASVATAYRTEIQGYVEQAKSVAEIEVPDDVMRAVDADPDSEFRQQQDARLFTSIAEQVEPVQAELDAAPATYAQRALDDDGAPIVTTTSGKTRILTPETALTTYKKRESAGTIQAKAFDPADLTSPTYDATVDSGHIAGWLLDASANESVHTVFSVPEHWTKITAVEINWVPLTAAGGNTLWRVNCFNIGHNTSLTAGGGSTVTSAPSAAQTTAYRDRVLNIPCNLTVDPSKFQRLWIQRFATDASDTYAGDVALVNVKVFGSA